LSTASHGFTLTIRDDGQGFLPESVLNRATTEADRFAGGNGLINMRERLKKIGGHFKIESAPGRGTTISFMLGDAARK
jgi:signal transduction histidine kinase